MPEVIGRENELVALGGFLDAPDGGPRALVFEGEAGIGKTTLWNAGVEQARARALRVLTARSVGPETRLSYASLTDVLGDLPEEALASLPPIQRHALEVALLRVEPGKAPVDHRTVAAGALGVLRSLAADGPIVMALDDPQWMDVPSREALSYVLRRLDHEPVKILAAVRLGEGCDDPLDLARTLPADRLTRIEVGPLSLEAIERLVLECLGHAPVGSALLDLHAVTGGNPLFALEIARATWDGGPRPGETRPLAVPRGLRAQVAGRLTGLPPDVWEVLVAIAALARPTVAVVSGVTDPPGTGLERAAERGLLEIRGAVVRPSHPLYASVAYADAQPDERTGIHRRLVDLVDDPEERARHLALSASAPDAGVAAILDGAAERARSRGAPTVAAELRLEARRFTPEEALEEALRRTLRAVDDLMVTEQIARARELLEASLPTCPPGRTRAEVLQRLGWLCTWLTAGTELDAGDAWLDEAESQAGEDSGLRSSIRRARHLIARQRGDLLAAAGHARAALEMAERGEDVAATAQTRAMVAWGEMATGRGLRREMICTVLQDWASADDTGRAALLDVHPYVLCGDALLFGDDVDGARRMYEAARREAEAIGSESLVAVALDFLYDAEILAGDWERAAGYVDEAERLMTANEDATAISRGDILAHLGRVDEARRILSDQTQRMESAGFLEIARYCRFSLGSLELSVGDLPEAHRHLSRATQLLMDSGSLEPGMGRFLPDAIETLVGLGDLAEAERLTDWLEERGRALNRVSALATGARCRGLLLSAKGDHGGALEHLERAMVEHERLPMPFERARTLLVLGAVRRRADHKRAAREALDEALEVFEHLGAVLWADKARAELASIGGRAVAIGELTPMESRVAHLAAAGRTNREIAETLFLSIRTVESHLSHAYHKLGVRSRTELALVLEDLAVT